MFTPTYKIVNKVSDLPEFDKSQPVFSDIETGGLYTDFRMVQFYQPQDGPQIYNNTNITPVYILDIAPLGYNKDEYEEELQKVKELAMELWTVYYNASYDLGTLNISPSLGMMSPYDKYTGYTKRVDDLYYAVKTAYAEFANEGFGLKKIVKRIRSTRGLYDSTEEDHGSKGFPPGSYISASAYRYSAIDVIALSILWRDPKIKSVIENNVAYNVDMMSQAYALIYQQNGLLLDREKWNEALSVAKANLFEAKSKLPSTLNVNSPKQVKEFLGTEKSDAATLISIVFEKGKDADVAQAIMETRRYSKQVKYLESINFDKMYTKFNVAGAGTGRFTSSGGDLPDGFNAQQIPRSFQPLFNSSTEDTEVIGLDYGTLELRLVAEIFGEPEMVQQFVEGRDLHTEMAIKISGKKLHPDGVINIEGYQSGKTGSIEAMNSEYITNLDRTIAKSVNFGLSNIAQVKGIELLGSLSAVE